MLFNVWVLKNAVYRASGAFSKTFLRWSLELFCINEKLKKIVWSIFRNTMRRHVMVTSHAWTAAARIILVKMEEHVRKYVSPRASGTTVLVQQSLLVDTVKRERAARPTELLEKRVLDCTQSLMTVINPFKCSVTLTLNLGLHGTWSSRSAYQRKTFLG